MNHDDPSAPAVELRGVSKRFGSRAILDNIDLRVARGEVLVLVGKSGSGKSTLLKIVSGIETPDAGRVFLAGQECTHLPPYRRAVHTVFQNYALFPHLAVAGNIAFPLAVAGIPRTERERRVSESLGWVQLEQHARRRVDTLSGGERQRVALARALVDRPDCVLLDEPLSALDPHLRAETLELLQSIQQRLRTTFLFITHDREEALRLGHRIGVLNGGRLEQVGTPEEVYRQPRTAFVASFLGRINWLTAAQCGPLAARGALAPRADTRHVPNDSAQPVVQATIGVRPEDLRIDPSGWLAARVVARQFLGDTTTLRLQLADGTPLIVDQREPADDSALGKEVRLSWLPEAMHCFPADESAADDAEGQA